MIIREVAGVSPLSPDFIKDLLPKLLKLLSPMNSMFPNIQISRLQAAKLVGLKA